MHMEKSQLRQHFRALRESLSEGEVVAASTALCQRLAGWPILQGARVALAYLAFRNEIDLGGLLNRLPVVQWVVPRVQGKELVLHRYDPVRLVRHHFGMLEPAADLPVVAVAQVDVVLVPGVAFDRHGGRLGFGGGFYDRFLARCSALRMGVTYDLCLADRLPMGSYDLYMDWVCTPTQLIQCEREAGKS